VIIKKFVSGFTNKKPQPC